MNIYIETLKNYGLSTKEAEIYLAMIKTGHDSILKISKTTDIKRSTVYLKIESLIKKNLVKTVIRGKKKFFIPVNPKKIVNELDKKKEEINKILPELNKVFEKHDHRPKINYYEGKVEIKKIYKKALECKSETLWFGSAMDMKKEFRDYYDKMINIRQYNKDIAIKDIVSSMKTDRDYARLQNQHNDPKIKVRIMPKNLYFFNADNIIFENKLVLLSIKKDYFAIIIESENIVNAYKALYQLAWNAAQIIE